MPLFYSTHLEKKPFTSVCIGPVRAVKCYSQGEGPVETEKADVPGRTPYVAIGYMAVELRASSL